MGKCACSVLTGIVSAVALCAQPCVVRYEPAAQVVLDTFAGRVMPKLTPFQPPSRIVIALFPNSIAPERRDAVASALMALVKSSGKSRPVSLAVFDSERFGMARSFATPAAWRNALRDAFTASDGPPSTVPAQALWASIAGWQSAFGGEWASVILAGALPEPSPDVRDYAVAWLNPRICSQKARLSYWNPGAATSAFWSSVANLTGGAALSDPVAVLDFAGTWAEASWTLPAVDFGFQLYDGKWQRGFAGALDMPLLAAAPGSTLPDIDRYGEWQALDKQITSANAANLAELVDRALAINPRDPIALRAGAEHAKNDRDFKHAAANLERLSKIHPADAALQAELGHTLFAAGDTGPAENALKAAHDAKAGGASVALELARIHLARHDDAGALPFLDEALAGDAGNTELWYARADAAARLGDVARQADSLEKALALDPHNLARRTALARLYMDSGDKAAALRHVRVVTADLPSDAAVRRQYAEFLDALKQPADALAVWKKAVEADPADEPAHYRVARLLLDAGAGGQAMEAADAGLSAAPQSARLYLLKAEALERQNRLFDARQTLRDASRTVQDPDLLERVAALEDISGRAAPQAYMALAGARESTPTLQRGLEVSLRDGDAQAAAFFSSRLAAAGQTPSPAWTARGASHARPETIISGGLDGLAFIARTRAHSPQTFFAEYCRTLVARLATADTKPKEIYLEALRTYFRELSDLKLLGAREKSSTSIVISVSDKKARERSERILGILGWKLRAGKTGVRLDAGEKASEARRQETASAIALDEVGMRESVTAGKSFTFVIRDEPAPVILGESAWMDAFFPKAKFNGGLAEAISTDVRAAKIYAALDSIGPRAVAALMEGIDLKTLAEKYADLLFLHGAALALQGDRAAVPGGAAAAEIWAGLVGVSPAQPPEFFRALLQKDEGKLLAFFAMLGQLDLDHQRFVTRSAARAKRFYELFQESNDLAAGAWRAAHGSSFAEFLQQIPLDSNWNVIFPGGPEVWTVFRGNSSSLAQTAKLNKRLSRIATPDQEDEILDRLARAHFTVGGERVSPLDHFVAIAQIDRHRDEPLDDRSALMLAENYELAKWVYPYFNELTNLQFAQFERFFALVAQLKPMPRLELNVILGELHSLTELICLLQRTGAIEPKAVADLFDRVCTSFAKASTAAGYTQASLETVQEMLRRVTLERARGIDADRALELALIGDGPPSEFELGGAARSVDPWAQRRAAYRKVLDEQHVTSLAALLEFYDHLQKLERGEGPRPGHAAALDALRPRLLNVELPKKSKAETLDKNIATAFSQSHLDDAVARLKKEVAKKKPSAGDIRDTCADLMAIIHPQVEIALAGIVYAYFLSPNDLLVSQDPLLLRKHRFLQFVTGRNEMFLRAEVVSSNEGLGSHIEGGFADFPVAAGKVAFSGASALGAASATAEAQFATLRATDWSRLTTQDLVAFGLRVRLAREWVLHAAADAKLFADLQDATYGILSPARRAALIDAIEARDWDDAFHNLTLGDLYQLSRRYLERYSADRWPSPVSDALRTRSAANDDARLRELGGVAPELTGCSHPHLGPLPAYEQYAGLLLPYKIAQRTAEFKLYLAAYAGAAGIPPAALNELGPAAALQAVKRMKMTDGSDWREAQLAFAGMDDAQILAAITGDK